MVIGQEPSVSSTTTCNAAGNAVDLLL